ncbi:tape measure protein [Serratia fonticola]|uniref:tape measure protein n=1 Tax=Serratia fonticola TaxID=47917 RepID=UPI003AAA399D
MASEKQVGNIIYQVQMDVQQLLTAQRQLNDRLAEMEDGFNQNADAAENLGSGLSKLAELIKLVVAASALRELASMVQKYQEMAERVQMATASQAEYEHVQKRLLDTANGTYRSLEEAQELYIRTADSLRSMNYTTEQAVDIQDSMSYAFVKNATAADRADAAISAFSKSVNTGKVAADQWETLTSAIPSVINDIAAASGKSAAQIRALGAAGKLTAKELTEGLRQSLDANAEAAKGMSNNLIDAGVRIKTAVTQIAVAFETQTGALQAFTNGLISAADGMLAFGQDSDKMSAAVQTGVTVATAFAALMGGRFAGSLAQSTSAKLTGIIASRQLAMAEVQTAKAAEYAATAVVRRTVADKAAAISALSLAQVEYNVARGSAAEAFALDNLNAKKSIAIAVSADLVVAENALAAATTRSAAAARAASAAWTLAKGALALIGGPAGVAFLAAAALFYFYQRAEEAKKAAIDLADGVNGLIGKMQQMSRTQLLAEAAKLRVSFTLLSQEVGESRQAFNVAEAAVKRLEKQLSGLEAGSDAYKRKAAELSDAYDQQNIAADNLTQATNRLGQAKSGVRILTAQANGEFREGIDLLKRDGQEAGVVANLMNQLGKAISFAAGQKEKFNAASLSIERPQNVQDYLDKQLQQIELQSELNEKKRAQLKAEQEIRSLGGDDNAVRLARERAGAEFDSVKAQQELKKATQEGVSEGKKADGQAESIAQKLANLKQQTEQTADSTQELSREQAILAAKQSLGKGATQEQIDLAGKYRAEIWDTAAALKARNAVPELKENADYASQKAQLDMLQGAKDAQGKLLISQEQYNQQSAKLEQDHIIALAKIRAGQAVTPQQEAAALVDPVQDLANENAKKLALIREFETEKGAITENGLALMNAANKEYDEQRTAAQWQLLSQQSLGYDMLTSAVDAFSGNASNALTGLITGSMSAEEAMRSLGSTMLNSVVNSLVQVGVEALKNFIIAQTIGVAGQAAATAAAVAGGAAALAAWSPAAIAASIATGGAASGTGLAAYQTAQLSGKALSIAGMRKNGGPVNAGSMYQVGEGGRPELLQAGGKQYMIPGDNGKVISNKDLQSGGGAAPTVIINNYSSAAVDARATQDSGGGWTIEAFIADMNNGGQASQAITANTTARRVPRGQG